MHNDNYSIIILLPIIYTLMLSVSAAFGAEAIIRSFAIFPVARNPLARAVAIFPAPMKPTDVTLAAIFSDNAYT